MPASVLTFWLLSGFNHTMYSALVSSVYLHWWWRSHILIYLSVLHLLGPANVLFLLHSSKNSWWLDTANHLW